MGLLLRGVETMEKVVKTFGVVKVDEMKKGEYIHVSFSVGFW